MFFNKNQNIKQNTNMIFAIYPTLKTILNSTKCIFLFIRYTQMKGVAATKLKSSLYVLPPITKRFAKNYGKTINGEFIGVSYYDIPVDVSNDILKRVIPKKYRGYFEVCWLEINNDYIPPHIDSDVNAVINIYIQTKGATTILYETRSSSKSIRVDNQTDGAVYNPEDIDEIDRFTANPYEAWILNVKKPHSVTCSSSNGDKIRSAYCIQTSYFSYNDLKNLLS
jgi:hypothetical protein